MTNRLDDEEEDQKLEAHYVYMAKIQEVTQAANADSRPIFNKEPLEKVTDIHKRTKIKQKGQNQAHDRKSVSKRSQRRSKQIVEPEPSSIEETPVDTMADTPTMSELLQAPTEGYGDAIVIPDILAQKFELKVELLMLTTNLKNDITNFQQIDETFSEAWDRFKDLLLSTTTSSSLSPDVTALTEIVIELLLMNKATQQAIMKAIEETCVTYSGPHPYYECLAAGGNTFDACAAVGTYNQRDNGYRPQGDSIIRQSPSGLGSLSSNTVAKPRGDVKAITTRSGVSYNGPTIPPTSSPHQKEVERETEATKDKFASTFNSLLSNKEKLFELANNPLTENSSAVLLKKLPKKLGDLGRFLIPCDFYGLESCMALADLGASINLMPLSVWKKLSLLDLNPTHMTLELATRSIAYPAGIVEDVFMQVGKFTFPADFVAIDYDVDLRVSLILGRPFLRTANALVDVHRKELILRDDDEQLIFHADSTLKHPHSMIVEAHVDESNDLLTQLLTSDSTLPKESSESSEIASSSSFPFRNEEKVFNPGILILGETQIFNDEAKAKDLKDKDLILKEHNFLSISSDQELLFFLELTVIETLLSFSSKNEDKVFNPEILISNGLLTSDSTLPKESSESSEIASSSSFPFRNEEKVFNPGILILGETQIFNDEAKAKDLKDKDLILKEHNFLSISSDQELLFFLELTVIETLLSFSSKNKDKVFNPEILISNGVHSFTLRLSHRTYENFEIINIHPNIFNEGLMKIFPFFCFCPNDKGIQGESS
nr:reverse transcriptase domain-containing protein [Tanacetum cinerariifolium]